MIPTLYEPFRHWSEGGSVFILSDLHFNDDDCKLMDPDWISPEEQISIINKSVAKGAYKDLFDEIYTGPLFIADKGRTTIRIDKLAAQEIFGDYQNKKINSAEAARLLEISKSTFLRRYKEYIKARQ